MKMHHWYQQNRWQPAANSATGTSGVVDTGGTFAIGVNNTGGTFAIGVNNTGGK